MMNTSVEHLALALLLFTPAITAAATNDAGARIEQIGPGVYASVHGDAADQWPHGNAGVIVTDGAWR